MCEQKRKAFNIKNAHAFTDDLLFRPESCVFSLTTVIFITSYRAFIWHPIGDEDSCTSH